MYVFNTLLPIDTKKIPLEDSTWNKGIPGELINQVIDEYATEVLSKVHNKLNTEGNSFIIPSNVADHLIKVGCAPLNLWGCVVEIY